MRPKYKSNTFVYQTKEDGAIPIWPHQEHKKAVAKGYITIDGLQLLCANCHAIKTRTVDKKLFC